MDDNTVKMKTEEIEWTANLTEYRKAPSEHVIYYIRESCELQEGAIHQGIPVSYTHLDVYKRQDEMYHHNIHFFLMLFCVQHHCIFLKIFLAANIVCINTHHLPNCRYLFNFMILK